MVASKWGFLRINLFVFNTIGEIVFVEVEAGFPFLAFAEAEVFHEFSGGVAEPNWDGLIWSFASEILSGIPSVGGGARFFGKTECDDGVGKNEARFWHADALDGLKTSGGK